MEIRSFQDADEPQIIRLWERCGLVRPWNDRDNLEALAFYERIGFSEDAVVSLGKRLERDDKKTSA